MPWQGTSKIKSTILALVVSLGLVGITILSVIVCYQ